ncbi:MAG: hypothetical protein WD267_02220 [Balneolales bacterium]
MIKNLLFILMILLLGSSMQANAQLGDKLNLKGYVQGMPLWINADLPEPYDAGSLWELRLQNRLDLQYYISENWTFSWEMRTRFFTGDLVRDIPFYAESIDIDQGYFNFSWLIADQDNWMMHYIPDRLYLDWTKSDWSVRIGRQRINWGINNFTNPNDLFNIYSFYDFDYPERPGTDAIRIQRYTGAFSRWELAVSPGREIDNSVAALMYAFNTKGYDVQVLGGYYHDRLAIGGGWAGSISQTGFKGEVMLFSDLVEDNGNETANIILTVSADHMFSNSIYLLVEALYNQRGGQDTFLLIGERLSADNPSFSRYQLTGQVNYPFSPILNGTLAAGVYPDEEAAYLSPSFTFSMLQNLDLMLLAQIFAGSEESAFANAGNIIAGSITWSF